MIPNYAIKHAIDEYLTQRPWQKGQEQRDFEAAVKLHMQLQEELTPIADFEKLRPNVECKENAPPVSMVSYSQQVHRIII